MATTKPSDEMVNFTGWFPVGWTVLWPTESPPTTMIPGQEWVVVQNQEVSRSTYSELFALIGTTYGVGNGTTTFNLPMRNRFIRAGTPGSTGGADTHTLSEAEMPSHTHNMPYGVIHAAVILAGGAVTNGTTSTTGSAGGGQPHNNMPAYQNWSLLMRIK